jgi:hypothetical protein
MRRAEINDLARQGTFVNEGPTPEEMRRAEINDLARQGTFVNEGPTPEEMERAQRMYGENPGGPGYRGSPGFGRNRA